MLVKGFLRTSKQFKQEHFGALGDTQIDGMQAAEHQRFHARFGICDLAVIDFEIACRAKADRNSCRW